MIISEPKKEDFKKLADLWEASVRASHFFLEEEDIPRLKEEILHIYFFAVSLRVCKDEKGLILGFVGVNDGKVEMLFVEPESFGKGVGKILLSHATLEMGATELDVNEANSLAKDFYLHMGFEVTGRSPLDGEGRPYPLLHMKLNERNA